MLELAGQLVIIFELAVSTKLNNKPVIKLLTKTLASTWKANVAIFFFLIRFLPNLIYQRISPCRLMPFAPIYKSESRPCDYHVT